MNIFIDTNVLLSFYHFSSDDLAELKKLAVVAQRGEVKLFVPDQVVDEFRRNRANKIADAMKKLREQKISLQYPQICRHYEEYELLRNAHASFEEHRTKLAAKVEADISENNLEADRVIEDLFAVAHKPQSSPKVLASARQRMELGRPPGKKGSLGDAINWELLLLEVPDNEDLDFITDDNDFFSPLDSNSLDPYLLDEWFRKKHSHLHPHRRLSAFLARHFPDIELETELEKDQLIAELALSRKFAQTRSLVARLAKFSDFSNSQANEILEAAITNNQIYWIANELDIRAFLQSILDGREEQLDADNIRRLRYVFEEMKPYGRIPF